MFGKWLKKKLDTAILVVQVPVFNCVDLKMIDTWVTTKSIRITPSL